MLLVVGLGNPGREHEGQRHNVGFTVTGELRRRWGLPEPRARWNALWTRGVALGADVALLEPQTYMNLSGDAVQPAAAFLEVKPGDLVVVHDELDLRWKDVRLKVGGGHGGHNGLRSLIARVGTPDFVRVRVGVGRPPPGWDPARWVLSRFDPVDRAELPDVVARAADAVELVVTRGVAAAMSALHTKP